MNDFSEPVRPTKIMIKMVIVAAAIIILIGAVYYRSFAVIPFIFGVAATSGLNVFKLRMLERTVQKVVVMDDQAAGKNIVRFQYLLRYLLTGAVLVIIGLIHTYTTEPPFYSDRNWISIWGILFPNAPASLVSAPLISIWGALAGLFTLQISVILVRSMKLEKDGDNFIKYEDDEENDDSDSDNNDETADVIIENDSNTQAVENDNENNVNS
ncbi:MAG: hypothetical protein FWD38_04615 [Oscillospiraceae bacterium]|nr:hypothetical protein [Oscillospiraceae bacterium]